MPKQLNVNLAFTADTTQAKRQLQDLQKMLSELTSSTIKNNAGTQMTEELQKSVVAASQLKDMLQQATNPKTGNLDLSRFSEQIKASGKDIQDYAQNLSNLGPQGTKAFMQLAQSVAAAEVPMKRTNAILDTMKTTIMNAARWQISSSIIHGFMGAVQGAYGYAQDLDKSLNSIRVVTGQSSEQMAELAEHANQAAQALSTSTLAYTDAALIYYQQGLDPEEVAARTETTLKMSNVTRDSAEAVSNYMTAIWNNFDDGSKSLEYYADVITALGAATASSSAEIANGMQQFAAVADTVGLSYDYAATALATIVAETRQSESTVGNGLRTIFSRLQGLSLGETLEDGTDLTKYSSALQTIGVNIKDQNGNLKDMNTILDEIGAKWNTLSKDTQVALAQTVGGVRQYTNLVALFDNWDKFQQNLSVAQSSEGSLQEQADIYAESWEAARKRVQAAWQAIYQDLINDEFFITILNGFEKVLSGVDALIDSMGGLQGVLGVVGTVITTVFSKELATGIQNAVYNFKVFTGQAQQEADAMAMQWKKAADEMAINLSSTSVDAETSALKDQIDFTLKLRQSSDELTEANKRQLLSLNEITKEYANAYVEARKLQEAAEEKRVDAIYQAREIGANNVNSTEKSAIRKDISQSLSHENILEDTKYYNQQLDVLSNLSKEITTVEQNYSGYWDTLKQLVPTYQDVLDHSVSLGEVFDEAGAILESSIATDEQKAEALKKLSQAFKEASNDSSALAEYLEESAIQSANELANKYHITGDALKELQQAFIEAAKASAQLAVAEEQADQAQDNYNKRLKEAEQEFEQLKGKAENYATTIVGVSRGLSQLLTAFSSFKSMLDTLNNQDLTWGEKISKIFSSLLIAVPMVINGLTTLNGALGISTVFQGVYTTAVANGTTALSAFNMALQGTIGWLGSFLIPILPIVAAIGALVGVLYLAYKNWNKEAEAAKKAAEEAKKAKETYDEVKQSFDELKSSLENHQNAVKALDDLTKGTQEWNEAVRQLNQDTLDLIAKYPELAQYIENINGAMVLNEEGMQHALDLQYTEMQKAGWTSLQKDINARNASDVSKATNAGRKISYRDPDDEDGLSSITVTAEEIMRAAEILQEVNYNQEAYREAIVQESSFSLDLKNALIQNIATVSDLASTMQSNKNSTDALIDAYYLSNIENDLGQQIRDNVGDDSYLIDPVENYLSEAAQALYDSLRESGLSEEEAFAQSILDIKNKYLNDVEYAANITQHADRMASGDIASQLKANGVDMRDQQAFDQAWGNLTDEQKTILLTYGIDEAKSYEELGAAADRLKEKLDAEKRLNFEIDEDSIDQDVDFEELNTLTDYIKDNADEINKDGEAWERFSEDLMVNRQASAELAEAILRFDDAIQDVTDNYDEWMDMLNSGSVQDAAKAASELTDTYGDLLDIDGSVLSADFLENTKNLEDMKAAIEGDEDAYERLQEAANQDIISHLTLVDDDFYTKLAAVQNEMNNINFQNIEIGADLMGYEDFISKLESMVNAAHMTAAQAEAYLANMGVNATVVEDTSEAEDTTETASFSPELVPSEPVSGQAWRMNDTEAEPVKLPYTFYGVKYNPEPDTVTTRKKTTAVALKIESANKSAGGAVKYQHSNHGAGANGSGNTRSPSKGSGGKGSSKSPTPKKKTVKEHKEQKKEEDRYHDLKERIDDVNTALNRMGKTKDRVYGKAKLKYMDQELARMKDQIALTKEYIKEAENYLKVDRAALEGIKKGAAFDENGMLTNYEEVLKNITDAYNNQLAQYNAAVNAFNASDQEDAATAAFEAEEKALEKAEKTFNENKKILKQYEDTYNLIQKQQEELIDQLNEYYDTLLENVDIKVQMKIDLEEDDKKLLEWMYKYIGDSADYAADKIANLTKQVKASKNELDIMRQGLVDIFKNHDMDVDINNLDADDLVSQLRAYMNQEGLASEMTEAEIAKIREYRDALMEYYDDMYDNMVKSNEVLREMMEEQDDRIQRQLDNYDRLADAIEHWNDIVELTGEDVLGLNTQELNRLDQSRVANDWNRMDSTKRYMEEREREYIRLQQSYAEAEAMGDELVLAEVRKNLELAEDLYHEAQDAWRDSWKKAQEDVNQAAENAMDRMVKDYKRALGDLDVLMERYDRQRENNHLYLEDYEKYHELNKSMKDLQNSMNNTNNQKILSKMRDLEDEINANMQNGVKISERQAEVIARRVALLQAEAELMDAQNAKSAVRMTRDNEGNFSYTYTADQEQIDDAEQNYGDKFYELMKYEKDEIEALEAERLQSEAQYIEDLRNLWDEYRNGDISSYEEYLALVDELTAQYEERRQYYSDQEAFLFDEQARLRDEDWRDFEEITGNKLAEQWNFVDEFEDTITGTLLPGYQSLDEAQANWAQAMTDGYEAAKKSADDWQKATHTTLDLAGADADNFKSKMLTDLGNINDKSIETKEKIEDMISGPDGMAEQFDAGIAKSDEFNQEFARHNEEEREQIRQTVAELNEMIRKLAETTQEEKNLETQSYITKGAVDTMAEAAESAQGAVEALTDAANGLANAAREAAAAINSIPSMPGGIPTSNGYGSCFEAGSKILMEDGSYKNIEEIIIGDVVMAYNEKTGEFAPKKVLESMSYISPNRIVKITLSNKEELIMTPGHPLLSTNGWKSLDLINSLLEHHVLASWLSINDIMIGFNKNISILNIQWITVPNNHHVYNITIDEWHTYLVNGIVAHNISGANKNINMTGGYQGKLSTSQRQWLTNISSAATGMYTGAWGNEGKLAVLHEKEIVLNRHDTENMLDIIGNVRRIIASIGSTNILDNFTDSISNIVPASASAQPIDQNVHIQASFPNVQSHNEIELALNNLINSASQFVNRK